MPKLTVKQCKTLISFLQDEYMEISIDAMRTGEITSKQQEDMDAIEDTIVDLKFQIVDMLEEKRVPIYA